MKLLKIVFIFFFLFIYFTNTNKTHAQTVLFSDDFETDNGSQWSIIRGNWIRKYVNSSMRYGFSLNTPSSTAEVQGGDFSWTNYNFAFDMLPITGTDRNVYFRVNTQRSGSFWGMDVPVSYGLHLYPYNIWLQRWNPLSQIEPVSLPISLPNNVVTHFKIQLIDNNIKVYINNSSTPLIDYSDLNNPILSGRIALAITTGSVYPTEVWFDNVVVTEISASTPTPSVIPTSSPTISPTSTPSPTASPTPTPTPTPSPSPSPTPTQSPTPTPANISKVFFVPGLGASWNLDAFATCKLDNYSGNWSLAPYAENVYLDVLSTLSSSGWDTKPFYYDWRKNVWNNANLLSTFITSNTASNEKVDLVGHSMGGLVGRSYFESNQGGQLAKFLTVGTPHQGSALAYPPWSGGEIWRSNLVEEIALDLYLKHCGGIFSNNRQTIQSHFSSIQNLLPTYDYIRDTDTKLLKPITPMKAKNNYLPSNFTSQFWGVKVGTLSGNGFQTLSNIVVVDPSKTDVKLGNWLDGKPVTKEYSNNGDGTVLMSSSQIDGANNMTINQTHSGLVGTTEGINKILNFLGSPGVSDPPFIEPKSALIFVGYPGNFYLTDKDGKVVNSKNGMVAIMNPQSGDCQLQITPLSANSTFIVGQFLTNGQTLYKEYKLKGLVQEPKIIKFDTVRPNENILHEVKEYKIPKPPSFPKFWFEFWNFLKNYWK